MFEKIKEQMKVTLLVGDIQDIEANISILRKGGIRSKLHRLILPATWKMTREQHIEYLKTVLEVKQIELDRLRGV